MRHLLPARALVLVSLLAVGSCDSGDDGTFTLTITDAVLSINQGVTDTAHISLARSDFGKDITLTIEGVPTGVVASFSNTVVPGNVSDVGLELAVAGTAPLGKVTLTVRANAPGKTEQVATMDLTVGLTGSYTLSSTGFPMTAAQSGGGTGTILIVREGGHADNVMLAASNVPAGITATIGTSTTNTISSPLTIAVGAGVSPGSYPITITGTAPGLSDQTTQVTVDVVAPPATASFSMSFCPTATPVWFAYQNTGYPWQVVTPVSGTFTFQATPTLAVAYTYGSNIETDLNILYTTRTELAGKDTRDCAGPKTHPGTISGAAAGQTVRVAMGAAVASPTAATPGFSITGVADRALDLVATKGTVANSSSNLQVTPDKLLIQRGLNLATGASLGTLDFGANGVAPMSTNLTIGNLTANDLMNVGNTFWSGTQTYGIVHSFQPTSATNLLFSMPAAQFQAGDLHELLIETYQPGFSFGRVNVAYLGAITGDRTETMGANLPTPSATQLTSAPYVRMRGQVAVQADYPTATRFIFFQDGGASQDRLVYLVATAGYLGATPATTWDVAIPEFGSVAGLDYTWLPSTPLLIYQAETYAAPGAVLFGGVPSPGDVVKVAYRVATTGSLLRAGMRAPAFRSGLRREIESRQYLRR